MGEILADVDPALGVPQLTGFENHQGVTQVGPRRQAAGPGHGRRRQRGRHRGRLRGPGAGHLPARPRAGAQPGPGRPAAQLGRRAAAPAGPGRGGVDHPVPRPAPGGRAAAELRAASTPVRPGLSRRAPGRRRRTTSATNVAAPAIRTPSRVSGGVMSRRAAHWVHSVTGPLASTLASRSPSGGACGRLKSSARPGSANQDASPVSHSEVGDPAGHRGRGHVEGLIAAFRVVLARGDLDDEAARAHGRTLT